MEDRESTTKPEGTGAGTIRYRYCSIADYFASLQAELPVAIDVVLHSTALATRVRPLKVYRQKLPHSCMVD